MKKRFVVLLNSSSKEQNDEFLDWLKEQNTGWWHWLSNSWLISNSRGHLSAQEIRNKLNEIYRGSNNLVLELGEDYDTWSGFGPKGEDKNMFGWIKKNWSK